MPAPLDDVRVIESSNWVAAPSAGAILADLGADVIKIEPLRGDAMRGMFRPARAADGHSTIDTGFHVDNRGKRSIAIAVDQPEGVELVKRLISSAQIFSTNLLPERQVRYGLDPESVFKVNSRIVHATMSGFGLVGPDATRPGFDVTAFFGRGSIIDSMTDPHENAPYPRPGQGDHVAGLAFLSAILAGLRLAERTGQGQVVDANLFSSATWTMATDLSAVLVDGRAPTKRDRHHAVSALANRYRCEDDRWLVLNMPDAAWWAKFCAFAQREELIDDPRFSTPKERHDNMPALVDIFDEIFAQRTLAEWSTLLDDAKLIWGPASSMTELAQDLQASAIGMFPEIEFREQPMRTVAAPLNIRGADVRPRAAGPSVGQHTVEILTSLGLDRAEIDALSAANVVLVPQEN